MAHYGSESEESFPEKEHALLFFAFGRFAFEGAGGSDARHMP